MHQGWWALAGGGAVAAGALLYGDARWKAGTKALRSRLEAARRRGPADLYDPAATTGLPAPVQRYFDAVLTPGQPRVAAVDLAHTGTFFVDGKSGAWKPFTSSQRVTIDRPGFDWDASIAFAPGVPVRVHDALIEGEGILQAYLWGLAPMAEQRDRGELARGELLRFLAEAAWYPTALLPGRGVEWTPIDETCAAATLTDGDLSARLTFRFDADGRISSVFTEARGRSVGKALAPTPWEGRFWNYERRDGMLVPTEGEVAWLLPEGRLPYWCGTIVCAEYDLERLSERT